MSKKVDVPPLAPSSALVFDPNELQVIEFSLSGKIGGRINATALACVRADRKNVGNGGIDAYNEMRADADAKSAEISFLNNAGKEARIDPVQALNLWAGFAEQHSLKIDLTGMHEFMINQASAGVNNEQVELLATATSVKADVISGNMEKERAENLAQLKDDLTSVWDILQSVQPQWDSEPISDQILKIVQESCDSTKVAIAKRRGKFEDKMSDLALITSLESRL